MTEPRTEDAPALIGRSGDGVGTVAMDRPAIGRDAVAARFGALPARLAELVAFGAIVVLAAVLRFSDLATRGTWDADQGHDMLVLRDLVERGVVPLLGPPTSIGEFHHGMLYYLLLAPAAAVSHADPTAVTAWIAAGGVVAVAVTGWLARSIAGPVAGLVAAGVMAVSASAVEESTFIWNPNLIALSSSVALAAAWRAWTTERPVWWVVAGAGAVVTMQCHVLGVVLTPVVGALLVADWSRRRQAGDARGAATVVTATGWWLLLAILSYVPLILHEAQTGGTELRAALAYIAAGGDPAAPSLAARLPIVALRVIAWPLTGLITAAPAAAFLVTALVVAIAVVLALPARRRGVDPDALDPAEAARASERTAIRWLAGGLAWTVIALAVAVPSLATVVLGLPNDHYHAFADPMVFVLVGVGIAALVRAGRSLAVERRPILRQLPIGAASVIVVGVVGWNLLHEPPPVAADGGWPAAERAATRVLARAGPLIALVSLPPVKSPDGLVFPLERLDPDVLGPPNASSSSGATQVVMCDDLFRESIGAACGGPAEDALVLEQRPAPELLDRFEAAPGRWISIYRPIAPPG